MSRSIEGFRRIDLVDGVHREWIGWCGPVRYVCRREKKKRCDPHCGSCGCVGVGEVDG
jgi:hypothetical protein